MDKVLLQLQGHRWTLIGGHDVRQAFLIKLPWHEQVLTHVDGHHAELAQCWA